MNVYRGCGRRYSIYDVIYNCEDCGGLLDVEHDLNELKKEVCLRKWKTLFDSRIRTNEWPYGSGVWGKKGMGLPANQMMKILCLCTKAIQTVSGERLGKEIGVGIYGSNLCGNSHTRII